MNAYIQTPQGDFDYVVTDYSKGCSCDQCVFGHKLSCPYIMDEDIIELVCQQFDTDGAHFHLQFHYEIGGVS